MALFQQTVIKKYLSLLNQGIVCAAYEQYKQYFHNVEIQDNIRNSKEEQFQEGFLRELFVKVLGYALNPSPNYNLITEQKNVSNAKKADGAILVNGEVVGVIELKDGKTTDLTKVEQQAFGYKNQHPKAVYVIISNFQKLRFYINNTIEYQEFDLFNLTFDDFKILYLLLAYPQIEHNIPKKVKEESLSTEDTITKSLYKDYSEFKRVLFADLLENNIVTSIEDKILLFKKSQKLLDRLLFIFFAEDSGLLSPNTMIRIISDWEKLKDLDAYTPLYERIKKYFNWLNEGYKGKDFEVFAYNGGLFKPDEILDNLVISDDLLYKHTHQLSKYDYASEVDVNILGHIFENSLTEIEEITNQLQEGSEPTISKRKKDGVFYTPQHVTKYIVENTIGKLCSEKKEELGIVEGEYFSDKKRQTATKQSLLDKLECYRDWLKGITICDPACGSGAFLSTALLFLKKEHELINEMQAKVTGGGIAFAYFENDILENNLYGVDINEESVEIAKLALWLRTAQPNRKLSSLNNNIKCGNSLISDPSIGGEKAFDWEKEFPEVFARGGFDIVIGNPPYGAEVSKEHLIPIITHFSDWGISKSLRDTYFVFYAKSLAEILKPKGYLGFITPNTWKLIDSAQDFRERLMNTNNRVYRITQYTDKVFADATVDCDALFVQTETTGDNVCIDFVRGYEVINSHTISQATLGKQRFFNLCLTEKDYTLLEKIRNNSLYVKDELIIKNGVKPYEKGKGKPAQTAETLRIKPFTSEVKIDDSFSPLIGGSYFHRYKILWNNNYWIKYGEWLAAPRDKETFDADEKLIFRQTSDSLIGNIIGKGFIMRNNTHILLNKQNSIYNLKFILACLNSKLLNYYYWTINPEKGEAMAEVKAFHLGLMPIKNIPPITQQPFVELVNDILSFNKDLQTQCNRFLRRVTENIPNIKINSILENFYLLDFEKFIIELNKQKIKLSLLQQDEWEDYFNHYKEECSKLADAITATDNKIDELVYKLYNLTEEEIKIVEKI